ncbi:hypothetical protein CVT23_09395 [Minwuia thermotolerans]|uniref:Uncharacterized protein n=1 Tax=Minwuia thermotolerans TaxID=2056226 RepID=A0A2M9G2N1_9PROT|nr:hypothetical protein CVT23_09395 [Minwuia thermotolerans]
MPVESTANNNGWTELTNGDATSAKFQVWKGLFVIRYTVNDSPPAADAGGWIYGVREGEGYSPLSSQTPLSGAKRIWARPWEGWDAGTITVSHD